MIFYFIAGWISGAVGVLMFLGWWFRKHTVVHKVDLEELEGILHEKGCAEDEDVSGDREGRGISELDRDDV